MPKKKPVDRPAPDVPTLPKVKGKLGEMVRLMRREEGATVPQLMEATGWLENSIRGALAGSLRKRGLTIVSAKEGEVRTYRVADPAPPSLVTEPDAAPVHP